MDGLDRYPEPDGRDAFDVRDSADAGYLDDETRLEEAGYDGITSDEVDDDGYIPDTPPITTGTIALVGEVSDAGLLKDSTGSVETGGGEEDRLASQADIADLHHTIRRAASTGSGQEIPDEATDPDIRHERQILEAALPESARRLLARVPIGRDTEFISYHEIRVACGEGITTRGDETDYALESSTTAEVQFERRESGPYAERTINLGYATERYSGVPNTDHSSAAYGVVRHINAHTMNITGNRAFIDEHHDTFVADPELYTHRRLSRDEVAQIAEHLNHARSLEGY